MFLLVSMLQFVAHGSRLDSMAIVWARFFENFASCLQGRNEVGWRLGQAASLAPMFERKVFWMQIFPLKKVLVTLWDFLTPSSSYSAFRHPHRDLAPEELCPPLPSLCSCMPRTQVSRLLVCLSSWIFFTTFPLVLDVRIGWAGPFFYKTEVMTKKMIITFVCSALTRWFRCHFRLHMVFVKFLALEFQRLFIIHPQHVNQSTHYVQPDLRWTAIMPGCLVTSEYGSVTHGILSTTAMFSILVMGHCLRCWVDWLICSCS